MFGLENGTLIKFARHWATDQMTMFLTELEDNEQTSRIFKYPFGP